MTTSTGWYSNLQIPTGVTESLPRYGQKAGLPEDDGSIPILTLTRDCTYATTSTASSHLIVVVLWPPPPCHYHCQCHVTMALAMCISSLSSLGCCSHDVMVAMLFLLCPSLCPLLSSSSLPLPSSLLSCCLPHPCPCCCCCLHCQLMQIDTDMPNVSTHPLPLTPASMPIHDDNNIDNSMRPHKKNVSTIVSFLLLI